MRHHYPTQLVNTQPEGNNSKKTLLNLTVIISKFIFDSHPTAQCTFLHVLGRNRMTTWGIANWENSQTTWDYRQNRELEDPQANDLYAKPNVQSMGNRFQSPRKHTTDSLSTLNSEALYSLNGSNKNILAVTPSGKGYVTATIRRNNLPKSSKSKQYR